MIGATVGAPGFVLPPKANELMSAWPLDDRTDNRQLPKGGRCNHRPGKRPHQDFAYRKPCQTSAPVSRRGSGNDLCPHLSGEIGKFRQSNCCRQPMTLRANWKADRQARANGCASLWVGNDDRYSHADSLITTTGRGRRRAATRRLPQARPARPAASPSDASTGTSSPQIP